MLLRMKMLGWNFRFNALVNCQELQFLDIYKCGLSSDAETVLYVLQGRECHVCDIEDNDE